jgi:hypothetical protein
VDVGGSGYVSPSIVFSGGGGSGAAATAVISGTSIVSVNITNVGTGYTSSPTAIVTDSNGIGCVLYPVSEAIFLVSVNRKYQSIVPVVFTQQPPQTSIVNTIRTSSDSYVVGEHEIFPINTATSTGKSSALLNTKTETTIGSPASTQMIMRLGTTNANVSPVVDLAETPSLRMLNYLINSKTNAASEVSPNTGTALSRYISQITTIATPSTGVRVFVSAISSPNTSFDVYIRTSLSSSSTQHRSGNWISLVCNVDRNLSSSGETKDYEFYLNTLSQFDVYDIKIVLYSENKYQYPIVSNYRTIILAT